MKKVSFIYAFPLDQNRRKLSENESGRYYPSPDEVREVLLRWETKWDEIDADDNVMSTLEFLTKRVPTRKFECFVFGSGLNPMSAPFLMPVIGRGGKIRSDDDFIQTMIHELLHLFVTENTFEYWTMIRDKYKEHGILTQNHIIVYAMLRAVYNSLWKKIPPDFSREDLPFGYSRAIQVVKQEGYEDIISQYHALVD